MCASEKRMLGPGGPYVSCEDGLMYQPLELPESLVTETHYYM